MESEKLYKITKKDFPRLEQILTKCFEEDPLYCTLIPDPKVRQKLMPQLFKCDVEEMFSTCDIFSDSPEVNSVLVVSDESHPYNRIKYYMTEFLASLKTDEQLVKLDPSLRTLIKFMAGREYLNSSWTDMIEQHDRIHIVYLAVDPSMQHHEIAAKLVDEVINYANENKLMISLETHNEKNVNFYRHFGFDMYDVVEKCYGLKQYCMIKKYFEKPLCEEAEKIS